MTIFMTLGQRLGRLGNADSVYDVLMKFYVTGHNDVANSGADNLFEWVDKALNCSSACTLDLPHPSLRIVH